MTTVKERFWSHVDKSGECWIWTGSRLPFGYGQLFVHGAGRPIRAHRLSWEWANGTIPAGLIILHECDNPPCVRPEHLRLGTKADNSADMAAKSRAKFWARPGEANPHATLTWPIVREIRRLYSTGLHTQRALAEKFETSQPNIGRITRGKVWIEQGV